MLKTTLGLIAVVIGFYGYGLYIRDVFRGRTRPHVFTWLAWGLMLSMTFVAQLTRGGGAGAWVSGAAGLTCLFIASLAVWRGEKRITLLDWFAFGGVLVGLVFWKLTAEPLSALLVLIAVDILAFIPTFRKSFHKPGEETVGVYVANSLKFTIGLLALESYNLVTWLYPTYLVFSNGAFVVMLWVRRWHYEKVKGESKK